MKRLVSMAFKHLQDGGDVVVTGNGVLSPALVVAMLQFSTMECTWTWAEPWLNLLSAFYEYVFVHRRVQGKIAATET